MSLFSELKRRNVVRMAVLYVVAGWVILQIADVLFDQLGVPAWAFRLVLGLLILGFPLALIFSWVFELTPEGLKRTQAVNAEHFAVQQTGQRMNALIVVLLVVAIGMVAVDRFFPSDAKPAAGPAVSDSQADATTQPGEASISPKASDNSIAVLPFVNMSGDPDNDYFSDGLAEELLNALVRIGGLKVTGRTSSFAFKGENRDLREIGDILDVSNVLEGSVRKDGNRVRITAQLIKTSDGFHLWSDTFDRELEDIFAVQQEIADQVTKALHIALLGTPAVTASQDPEAYEEYLRGLYIWQRNPDELEPLNRAQSHFENALAIDPEYVDALWGMFMVWDRKHRNGWGPFQESFDRLQQIANELERLAPASDQTLSAIGRLAVLQSDYEKSKVYLGEAASLYPASVSVLGEYASALANLGEYPEAIEVVDRASALDPLSLNIMRWKSYINFKDGDCEAVEEVRRRALEMQPDVGRFNYYSAMCIYETQGDTANALSLAEQEPLSWAHNSALAILYDANGDTKTAQDYYDAMFAEYGDAASYQYGQVLAQWGDIELALDWLERAINIRDPGVIQMSDDRLLIPLRDDPRFEQLLRDAGHL